MSRVSVLITALNEKLLGPTIASVLDAATGDVEVVVVLDGYRHAEPLPQDPRVIVFESCHVGQREAVNQAARLASGKYVMKLDAHCSLGEGFDEILQETCEYDWTIIPRRYELDTATWQPRLGKVFDYMVLTAPVSGQRPLRAIHWREYGKRAGPRDMAIDDVMCGQGSCFFMQKARYWELGGLDDANYGGWGQMGCEIALKSWLSGGAHMVNKLTWYAHWQRGKSGGKPYLLDPKQTQRAVDYSAALWLNDGWPGQTRPLRWLIEKFSPVPGWDEYMASF